jgi:hypothetical protein
MTAMMAQTLDVARNDTAARPLAYRLVGLAFATVLPALFWVAVTIAVGRLFGVQFSALSMVAFGTAVAAFLGSVCAPIVMKA